MNISPESPDNEPEKTPEGTPTLQRADAQLRIIEETVGATTSLESRQRAVDVTLKMLVHDVIDDYRSGKLDLAKAGDMLLVAIEKIDEYKDDDDPRTNGEVIAAALAQAPPELIEGPLRDFAEAEGSDELMAVLGEISRYPCEAA